MTNWATILNKISLQKKKGDFEFFQVDVSFTSNCWTVVLNLVSLDWETSLLMLARVNLRNQSVAQNKIQFNLNQT